MSENVTAQSPTTAGCRIDVREYGQTYIARAAGLNITASCTCGAKAAAERCADKVFGAGNWERLRVDKTTFIFTRKAAKTRGVWRDPAKDLPDDEIAVLVRCRSGAEEYPVTVGQRMAGAWWPLDADGADCLDPDDVVGWMHLHEAAHILDAATRGEAAHG